MDILIKKVYAPLNIHMLGNIHDDIVYEFNYEKSQFNINKPNEFLTYIENIGCEVDILVPSSTSFEEKEKLILLYFNSSKFFKVLSMVETLLHILFIKKGIKIKGLKCSFLTEQECLKFIANNENFINTLISFFDSLFVIMLLLSHSNASISDLKSQYGIERTVDTTIPHNVCNLLYHPSFYDYYKKGVDNNNIKYYDYVFNKQLFGQKSFIDVLLNAENSLYPVLVDMSNPRFQKFLKKFN